MRDLTMRCGWCGSTDVEAEYVHNGVGYQQCGPHICATCHAVEISPYNEDPVTDEEKLRGYHMGDESEELRVSWPPYWDVPRRAKLRGTRSAEDDIPAWLAGIVHVAHVRKGTFHICCRSLQQLEELLEPDNDTITCLACQTCCGHANRRPS